MNFAPRWRGWLGKLGLLGTSLVLAFFLLELGLRIFLPQQLIQLPHQLLEFDPTIGWRYTKGLDVTVNTGEGTVRFVTDEAGYRVAPGRVPKADVRVLALGDSFLAALQVDYEDTFAARLEGMLAEHLGTSVRVFNAGVGGWNPNEYLQRAKQAFDQGEFDAVLVALYAGNDVVGRRYTVDELRAEIEEQPEPTTRDRASWTLYALNNFLEVRSHAFKFLRDRGRFMMTRVGLGAYNFPSVILTRSADSESWAITAEICRDIADLAAEHGAPTLFVSLPGVYQVDRELATPYMEAFGIEGHEVDLDQPSRLLGAAMDAQGLRFVDATDEMRRLTVDEGRQLYGEIDTHFNAEGHRVAAEILLEPMLELLRGDPTPGG